MVATVGVCVSLGRVDSRGSLMSGYFIGCRLGLVPHARDIIVMWGLRSVVAQVLGIYMALGW